MRDLVEQQLSSTRDLSALEQTPTTTTLGMTMTTVDGKTFKGVESARTIAGGWVQMQEVAVIQAKRWHTGRLGGVVAWPAAQKFTPTRVTSHLFRTRDVHTAGRIHAFCHRTPKRTLVSTTTFEAGMIFKAVAPATTTVAGLEIPDLVAIPLSAASRAGLTGAVDLQAPISPAACRVSSLNGISKNAKARDKRVANLRAQAIGTKATVTITVVGMTCKAVEAAMIIAVGWA
jgi:hypothetical protein